MLQLKLSKVSFSDDGTQLVIQDTTGNYNSVTNPTGYGTPNRDISTDIILRWKLYNSANWTQIAGVAQADLAAGFTINTDNLGLTDGTGTYGLIPDGVMFIQYLGLYSKGQSVVVVSGSKRVTFSSPLTLSSFTGIDYIAFGSDLTTIYKIVSRGSNYLILDNCYNGSLSSETIYDAQNGDLFQLIQTYSNQCLDKLVAGQSEEQLCGQKLEMVFYKMMRQFIAQARFGINDYYGSDLIMQNLYSEWWRYNGCR